MGKQSKVPQKDVRTTKHKANSEDNPNRKKKNCICPEEKDHQDQTISDRSDAPAIDLSKLKLVTKVVIEEQCKQLADDFIRRKQLTSLSDAPSPKKSSEKPPSDKKKANNSKTRGSARLKAFATSQSKPTPSQKRSYNHRRKALVNALSRFRSSQRRSSQKDKAHPSGVKVPPRHKISPGPNCEIKSATFPQRRSIRIKKPIIALKKFNNSKMDTVPEKVGEKKQIESSSLALAHKSKVVPPQENLAEFTKDNDNTATEDDSDDDVQMQVLEKQVPSDKEEDEEEEDASGVCLDFPDDSDESSLLSPSAPPATSHYSHPSSIRRKKKRISEPKPEDPYELPSMMSSTPITSYQPVRSLANSSSFGFRMPSPSTSSGGILGIGNIPSPEKRGRGRPRKALEDVKSVSGKLYRRKLAELDAVNRNQDGDEAPEEYNFYISSPILDTSTSSKADLLWTTTPPVSTNSDASPTKSSSSNLLSKPDGEANSQSPDKGLQRWKNRSTFVYAQHKFVKTPTSDDQDKFKCDICNVTFTALSSLKRHYGTIYHKQQNAIVTGGDSNSTSDPSVFSSNPPFPKNNRGRGKKGKPATNRFRRNAVGNIKRFYLNADAARRKRETFGDGKIQRKRKPPAFHQDFIPTSAIVGSMDAPYARIKYSYEFRDDTENNNPEHVEIDELINKYTVDTEAPQTPWLSNVWKGEGTPHLTCEVCHERFTLKRKFTEHLFQHRQDEEKEEIRRKRTTVSCPEPDCKFSAPTEARLKQHMQAYQHGSGLYGEVQIKPQGVKIFSCIKCTCKFSKQEYFVKHLETHKRPLQQCPHCPETFQFKFYLNTHIKEDHAEILGLTNASNNAPNSSSNPTHLLENNELNADPELPAPESEANPVSDLNSPCTTTTANSKIRYSRTVEVELYSATTKIIPEGGKRKSIKNVATPSVPTPSASPQKPPAALSASATRASIGSKNSVVLPATETADRGATSQDLMVANDITSDNTNDTEMTDSVDLTCSLGRPKDHVDILEKFFSSQRVTELESNRDSEDILANLGNAPTPAPRGSSAEITPTSQGPTTSTEDGKLVIQFGPLLNERTFDNFGGESCALSPLTIEIPRYKINVVENVAIAKTKDGTQVDIVEASAPKDSPSLTSGMSEKVLVPQRPSSSTPSIPSLPLLGCGNRDALATKPAEDALTCQDCGKVFEHRKSLSKHVRYYTQGEDYHCSICNKAFKLKHHVSRHMKSTHNVDTSSTTSSTSADTRVDDLLMDMDFLNSPPGSSSSFVMKPLTSSVPPPVITTSPVKPQAVNPTRHKRSSSSSSKSPSASNSNRKSKKRDFDYESLPVTGTSKYLKPVSEHGPRSPEDAFKTVVDSSSGTVAFKCPVCKIVYPTLVQLDTHTCSSIPTLTFNLNHKCSVCKQSFKFKHELIEHQQIHSTDKSKFACDQCSGKTFSSKKDLGRHQREKHSLTKSGTSKKSVTPTQEDLVSRCSLCPLVFPQESDLHNHITEHHMERKKDDEEDADEDGPPTPSPHTSPLRTLSPQEDEDDDDDDDDDEEEVPQSDPESELFNV